MIITHATNGLRSQASSFHFWQGWGLWEQGCAFLFSLFSLVLPPILLCQTHINTHTLQHALTAQSSQSTAQHGSAYSKGNSSTWVRFSCFNSLWNTTASPYIWNLYTDIINYSMNSCKPQPHLCFFLWDYLSCHIDCYTWEQNLLNLINIAT